MRSKVCLKMRPMARLKRIFGPQDASRCLPFCNKKPKVFRKPRITYQAAPSINGDHFNEPFLPKPPTCTSDLKPFTASMVRGKPAGCYSSQSGASGGYAELKRKKEVAEVEKRRLEIKVKDLIEEKKLLEEEKKKVEEDNVNLKKEVDILRRDKDEVQERLEKEKEEKQRLRQISGVLSAAKRLSGE